MTYRIKYKLVRTAYNILHGLYNIPLSYFNFYHHPYAHDVTVTAAGHVL